MPGPSGPSVSLTYTNSLAYISHKKFKSRTLLLCYQYITLVYIYSEIYLIKRLLCYILHLGRAWKTGVFWSSW